MIKWLKRLFGAGASVSTANTPEGKSQTDTEFTAEVVRVTDVLPHPNADKLEIAKFELRDVGPTTYEVVIQKGQYKQGDLAAYLSVDCIVPTAHPAFAFLTQRLDGAGKTHYRLRAARLRGVFSQGLLVDRPDTHDFGDRVDETFGVTYHRPPEPGQPTQPNSTKKPKAQPCPVYGVESLKKVPRLFEEGEKVVVTEKIHGCNFRFGWVPRKILGIRVGWKFVIGSHRVMKDGTSAGWYGEDVWTMFAKDNNLAAKTWDYRGHIFYGELYGYTWQGTPIQDLTYARRRDEGPGLVVFDVLQLKPFHWLSPSERAWVLTDVELEEPPLLYVGEFHPGILEQAEGKSCMRGARHQIREGIVVESVSGPRRKAKFVGQGYLLRKES